jgi:hypothetical protein
VYGLPIVHDVAKYGEVLRDIRTGLVQEVLWFFEPNHTDSFAGDGRCLVRYKDGRVRQSVVPLQDFRVPYAMQAHGVKVSACSEMPGCAALLAGCQDRWCLCVAPQVHGM